MLLRKLGPEQPSLEIQLALETLERNGIIDWGNAGSESEFFLLRLKDQFAEPALKAYADAAEDFDFEFASEVRELRRRSGRYSESETARLTHHH